MPRASAKASIGYASRICSTVVMEASGFDIGGGFSYRPPHLCAGPCIGSHRRLRPVAYEADCFRTWFVGDFLARFSLFLAMNNASCLRSAFWSIVKKDEYIRSRNGLG